MDALEAEMKTAEQTNACFAAGAPRVADLRNALDVMETLQVDLEFAEPPDRPVKLAAAEAGVTVVKDILKDIKGADARSFARIFANCAKAQSARQAALFRCQDHKKQIEEFKTTRKKPAEQRLEAAKTRKLSAEEKLAQKEAVLKKEEEKNQELEALLTEAETVEATAKQDLKKFKEGLAKKRAELAAKKEKEKKQEKGVERKQAEFGQVERQVRSFEEKKKRGMEALLKDKYDSGFADEMFEKRQNQKRKKRGLLDSQGGTQDSERGGAGAKRAKRD